MKLTEDYIRMTLAVMKDCGFSGTRINLDIPYDDITYMELILDNNVIVADFYDIDNDLVWRIKKEYISELISELKRCGIYDIKIIQNY